MTRIVTGLGGNALLRRREHADASELVIVHGSGPEVGLLALGRETDPALNADCTEMLDRHHAYVRQRFEDLPEIREWTWQP